MVWESVKLKGAIISFLKTCLNINILILENSKTYSNCPDVFTTQGHRDVLWGDLLWICSLSLVVAAGVFEPTEAQVTGTGCARVPVEEATQFPGLCLFNPVSDSALDFRLLIQTFAGQHLR